MAIDRAIEDAAVISERFQELVARHGFSVPPYELEQKIALGRRELDLTPVEVHHATGRVYGHFPDPNAFLIVRNAPRRKSARHFPVIAFVQKPRVEQQQVRTFFSQPGERIAGRSRAFDAKAARLQCASEVVRENVIFRDEKHEKIFRIRRAGGPFLAHFEA